MFLVVESNSFLLFPAISLRQRSAPIRANARCEARDAREFIEVRTRDSRDERDEVVPDGAFVGR